MEKIKKLIKENSKLLLGLLIGVFVMTSGIVVAAKVAKDRTDLSSSKSNENRSGSDKSASLSTKQATSTEEKTPNSSNSSGDATSSPTDATPNPNPTGPSVNTSEGNQPIPTPKDMTLKGIEGLVATVHVGQAIFAPNVTPQEATLSYQWRYRVGTDPATGAQIYANIPGANSNPYYPASTYLNKWISVVVTGTNGYMGSLPSPTDALVIN